MGEKESRKPAFIHDSSAVGVRSLAERLCVGDMRIKKKKKKKGFAREREYTPQYEKQQMIYEFSVKHSLRVGFPWCKLGFTGAQLACYSKAVFKMSFENSMSLLTASGESQQASVGLFQSGVNPIKISHILLKDYSFIPESLYCLQIDIQ